MILNGNEMLEPAVLDGFGLVYVFESQVARHIAEGRLVRVLRTIRPTVF
ncbi:MAG: hypothetical protein AAAC47_26690 [Pararhizobium sp.]